MKTLLLVVICCITVFAYDPPSSRVTLLQTGTIPREQMKESMMNFRDYGCAKIGFFPVDDQHVNVYCLNMLVAEL